ncbi:hypothetical protein [Pseudomonas japonica]|uniref:Uncharacterized protein n=1 Tax=Pseudomonas japonica TaxID=256466 RepID=A0A239KJB8_9PSED|nr:hypothetical protein [Pseudomonas japonica]SNT18477.1 hypothetical protein SAMN05444352_12755 [Pseudomonas japonica]
MNSQADSERAQDLERRLRAYEELEGRADWPGALNAVDCLALLALSVVMIGLALWLGGQP